MAFSKLFVSNLLALTMLFMPHIIYGQSNQAIAQLNDKSEIVVDFKNVTFDESYDPRNFMQSYDLEIKWSMLLGEATEIYDFTWYDDGAFTFDGKTITRNMVSKYPDLLKRFDRLKPYKVSLKVWSENGSLLGFTYVIDDVKILQTVSGKKGDGVIPGSPDWNEFLDWGTTHPEKIGASSESDLTKANARIFGKFRDEVLTYVPGYKAYTTIEELQWHDSDMRSIADTYEKYERGEMKPNDTKELDELLSGRIEECGNDMDAILSGCEEALEAPSESDYKIVRRNGQRAVLTTDDEVLIPFVDYDISSFDPETMTALAIDISVDNEGSFDHWVQQGYEVCMEQPWSTTLIDFVPYGDVRGDTDEITINQKGEVINVEEQRGWLNTTVYFCDYK